MRPHTMTLARHLVMPSVIGELTLVAHGPALAGVYFPGHWYPPTAAFRGSVVDADPVLDQAAEELTEYLAGARRTFDVPITVATGESGRPLYEQVWAMLTEIPYGGRTSYGALADRLGNRSLAQSVGQAVGHNPLSIVIPCHRVVGADGRLTGYAGGLERKQFLLELEEPGGCVTRLF